MDIYGKNRSSIFVSQPRLMTPEGTNGLSLPPARQNPVGRGSGIRGASPHLTVPSDRCGGFFSPAPAMFLVVPPLRCSIVEITVTWKVRL